MKNALVDYGQAEKLITMYLEGKHGGNTNAIEIESYKLVELLQSRNSPFANA